MAAAQAAEKLLKTMVMNEDWLDIYDEDICIKSSLKPFTKLIASKKKVSLKIFSHETSLKWSQKPS